MMKYDFKNLMILDIANNHQGDIEHGLNIIKSLGEITRNLGIKSALKFQFRQLDTFIHPKYRDREDIAHIPRFFSTMLSVEDYEKLIKEVRNQGMIPMCTPFDEESVDVIEKLDIEIIKIASCSAMDIPLIKRVASAKMPTVASTGGATINQIDHMVQIFKKENLDFALHHCVSIYPTPDDKLQLNQIDNLRNRYKGVSIGWSTHEDPDDVITVKMALAKGATLFERHVGLEDRGHKLNKYSSSPKQVENWLKSFLDAKVTLGSINRAPSSSEEQEALATLMRGVYVNKNIKNGDPIKREDVFFAMPLEKDGLTSGAWRDDLVADKDYDLNEVLNVDLSKQELNDEMIVNEIMLQVVGMLNDAKIFVGKDSAVEISHHYGLSRFREFGAVLIDVINRDYCKKIIIQLPRQKHPYHFHKRKEETFQILSGSLEVEKDGNPIHLKEGDIFLVEPGHYHKFSTLEGAIFEEVSTTHYNDDSFYQDEYIAKLPRAARKTKVENWEI
jgi:sialic acid synthase SpsE/mannose-6-phosphate isomerase-like protein (cupin superfamily)